MESFTADLRHKRGTSCDYCHVVMYRSRPQHQPPPFPAADIAFPSQGSRFYYFTFAHVIPARKFFYNNIINIIHSRWGAVDKQWWFSLAFYASWVLLLTTLQPESLVFQVHPQYFAMISGIGFSGIWTIQHKNAASKGQSLCSAWLTLLAMNTSGAVTGPNGRCDWIRRSSL